MTTPASSSIVVDHVDKTYYPSPPWMKTMVRSNIRQPVAALQGIDFSVGPGEIVAIVGPNGAGKTTTFRILVGLTTPTGGRATVMGHDAETEPVVVRRYVGWMPGDDRSLLMRLTCEENLRFHGRMQGMKGRNLKRRIAETLELVDLGHAAKKSIFALSAGMRARIQLGRALLHDPRVLILDEPTGAVDPVAAHGLMNLIVGIVEERRLAAIISSHRLEEIEALKSRVILLDRGRIRYDGDLDILRRTLDRPCLELEFGAEWAAHQAAADLEAEVGGLTVDAIEAHTLRLVLAEGTSAGHVLRLLTPLLGELHHIREVKRPLRDLLAEIYQGDDAADGTARLAGGSPNGSSPDSGSPDSGSARVGPIRGRQ